MKKSAFALISIVLLCSVLGIANMQQHLRLYDISRGKEISLSEAIPALKLDRIILVGEFHDNKKHHAAQLKIIRALKESGVRLAVGMEMFRSDSQPALDRWVAGDMDESEFKKIYFDNWTYPWSDYGMIFDYARKEKIPLIGLNVPMEITRQVARQGFQSLDNKQKAKLSNITCRVDKEYMDYIKKAYGAHAHGNFNFTYFCEAQLVWDNVMAINALDYLKKNPDAVVVILTGAGHAQKDGIPRQISKRSEVACAVILPEVKGVIDPATVGKNDADYIIMDIP
jgi:uncharacterized iron-regulated protein